MISNELNNLKSSPMLDLLYSQHNKDPNTIYLFIYTVQTSKLIKFVAIIFIESSFNL